jgi:anion-transporting  ArsA/GET3 family ATPase
MSTDEIERTAPHELRSPDIALGARRLIIVTGKGGTGKTTVAAALALAAAQSGTRVLLAEVGREEYLHRLVSPGSKPVGYAGRQLAPNLTVMRIDPFDAFAEYLAVQLRTRRLADLAFGNQGLRQLMEAAPGWRELITLGKLWHLEQQVGTDGRALHEMIVVDAPATGHGLTFLDIPRVVVSAVRSGPLARHAGLAHEMLMDRERTLLLPVSLAEELPVRETQELVTRLRGDIGVAVDRVVINRTVDTPFPGEPRLAAQAISALDSDLELTDGLTTGDVAICLDYHASRYDLSRHYEAELLAAVDLPGVRLPLLADAITHPEHLIPLGECLLASDGDPA